MVATWSDSDQSSSEAEEPKEECSLMAIEDESPEERVLELARVVWRSSWQLGKAGDPHTKSFFFPVVSAVTCADHHLEVDQSVDTTWASVDTLSQHSPEGVLGGSLVSTLPDLVSTLPDQFCPKGVLEGY
ncbi:hypothetical protein Taro_044503 [Colocasia esculenta]|uniref:Uncharacterized protein n=1 Tax=Colocasia esculenta TaxID=4460 RepID=A0A843X3E3_COLES|nr:hypothetical protein [Colocasia esculenta]